MSKQTVLDLMAGKSPDSVPVGFWWHFTSPFTVPDGTGDPALLQKTISGHIDLYNRVRPDVIKIMTEGYFTWPTLETVDISDPDQLNRVERADLSHPFFTQQLRLCREVSQAVGDGAATFYTLFNPYSIMEFSNTKRDGCPLSKDEMAEIIRRHPKEIRRVYDLIVEDYILFARQLLTEGGATGIFMALHNFNKLTKEEYMSVFHQSELRLFREISAIRDTLMLHVCGQNAGRPSDFSYYDELPFRILNLDTVWEHMTLGEAKARFPGKVLIGGFNQTGDLIYTGTREQLQAETERLVQEAGRDGIILGVGCAMNTERADIRRCRWIREKAHTL